ncbi:NUDIX domain-containing protein [Paenibacillus lautus]|uniref:NUDIX domain-containing protein n=1 Tax=Paenibacillus lautus TaxID=1401 RepID=UPI003D290DE8
MKIIVTGGAIIRDHHGRILLQRRSDYGNWGLPGGGMEAGESVEETMRREVLEETGLVSAIMNSMGSIADPECSIDIRTEMKWYL